VGQLLAALARLLGIRLALLGGRSGQLPAAFEGCLGVRGGALGCRVRQLAAALQGGFGVRSAAFCGGTGQFAATLGAGLQTMHDLLAQLRVQHVVRGARQRAGHLVGEPLGGAAPAPAQRRLARGVGGRDEQPTQQTHVGQERPPLLSLALRVGLVPKHVRAKVSRDHRQRECGRRHPRQLAGGQQHPTADLDGGVDLGERLGVRRNIAAHGIGQRLQAAHRRLCRLSCRFRVEQGVHSLADKDS